jgi:hypothetical protein
VSQGVRSRWEFTDAVDWITAVDEIENHLVFAGSRDGSLYILNRLGAPLKCLQCGSWVGTVRAVKPEGEWAGAATYLFIGTKQGLLTCVRVLVHDHDEVELQEIFRHVAGNTVRDIDLIARDDDVWVVAGSEDRHVYRVNLHDIIAHEASTTRAPVGSVRLNGWIRSVAFAFDSALDQPMVAAGCGDRNLHLLCESDFDAGTGSNSIEIPMDGKVTSILAHPKSPVIFCGSDAKQLAVVRCSRGKFAIQDRTAIPHRVAHLAFADATRQKIVIACENERIYVYDVGARGLSGYVDAAAPVLALRGSSGPQRLLLGYASGRLSCCGYALGALPQEAKRIGELTSLAEGDVQRYSETLLVGPKGASVEIGVGRFLQLTPQLDGAPQTCVAGTDEGEVVVIEAGEDRLRILHRETLTQARVWAVDSAWRSPSRLRVLAATSNNEIAELTIELADSPTTATRGPRLEVADWPREIRCVEGEPTTLLVCCENGELLLAGGSREPIQTDETLRTGCARRTAEGYELLIGSDEGAVTRRSESHVKWRHRAEDRVREVMMHGDKAIAVSEDRYLYVWDDWSGNLLWRYRFPNRALCVDVLLDAQRRQYYVVGCGDGYVYMLDHRGAIAGAYEFPDRIRDVKALGPKELLIACEDGRLYKAPTLDAFVAEHGGHNVQEQLDALSNPETRLSCAERLALLADIDDWPIQPDNQHHAELTSSLLETSEADVLERPLPHWSQVFAHALVRFALKVDLEAGRARIESFLRAMRTDANAQQAVLSCLALVGNDPLRRPIMDTVVVNVPIEDDWIREQLLDQVQRHGLLSLGEDGLCQWFRRVHIGFDAMAAIVVAAAESEQDDVAGAPLVQLIAFLKEPTADRGQLATLSARIGNEDKAVERCMEKLQALLLEPAADADAKLDWLRSWVDEELATTRAIEVVNELLDRFDPGPDTSAHTYGLLAELIHERMLRSAYRVSASEYLMLQFVCGFVRALGVRRSTSADVPLAAGG